MHFVSNFKNETKPPHILTHAGAFLRPFLVAHDHRNPCHWLAIEIFSDLLAIFAILSRSFNLTRYPILFDAMNSRRIVSPEWKRLELPDPLSRAGIPTPLHRAR